MIDTPSQEEEQTRLKRLGAITLSSLGHEIVVAGMVAVFAFGWIGAHWFMIKWGDDTGLPIVKSSEFFYLTAGGFYAALRLRPNIGGKGDQ